MRLWRDGQPEAWPGGNVGRLLEILLLRPNEAQPAQLLIEALWPGSAEDSTARHRLHVTVSRLRALLATDEAPPGAAWELGREGEDYLLQIPEGGIDRAEFERLAAKALADGDRSVAQAALEFWRGPAYEGFPISPGVQAEASALEALRLRLTDLVAPAGVDELLRRAKLHPSWPAGDLLDRTGTLALPGVGETRAIVVTAPAGYGKSTILAQWAQGQTHGVAWLNLDSGDDDPVRFWRSIELALREGLGGDVDVDLGTDRPGSAAMLGRWSTSDRAFGLVLDDLHHITSPVVQGEIGRLLAHLPRRCTLVAASREELAGPVAARLPEPVHRVSQADLRFDRVEVVRLVAGDDGRADQLLERTNGWPLAVIALHRSGADLPAGAPPDVERYVEDQLLAGLPDDVRDLVFVIAHLDAFTVDLCEAVTDRGDVADSLAWLRSRGLFLIEGPNRAHTWTRLHPLIAVVAQRQGAATTNVTKVWRRAGRWHREQGMDEEALNYAVLAQDRSAIAALAGDVLLHAALRAEAVRCVQWLQRIDPDDLAGDIRAHGIATYLAVEWMDRDDGLPWMLSRQRHFGGDDDAAQVIVDAIEAMREGHEALAVQISERVMHRCLERSWEHIEDLSDLLLGSAFLTLIRARTLLGTTAHDDGLFPSAVAMLRPRAPLLAAYVSSWWGLVALLDGEDVFAASLAEDYYQVRRSVDLGRPARRDNTLLGSLLAGRETSDPERLRQLGNGIEDLVVRLDRKGEHSEAAMCRVVAAGIYRRGGHDDLAKPHQRRFRALRRTFTDAAFLDRLEAWVDEHVVAIAPVPSHSSPMDLLTPRQREIVAHLPSDLSIAAIADQLYISPHTLRTHLRDIYRRLGVRSRHEAVARFR